jgi:hypothetical protein
MFLVELIPKLRLCHLLIHSSLYKVFLAQKSFSTNRKKSDGTHGTHGTKLKKPYIAKVLGQKKVP